MAWVNVGWGGEVGKNAEFDKDREMTKILKVRNESVINASYLTFRGVVEASGLCLCLHLLPQMRLGLEEGCEECYSVLNSVIETKESKRL